MYAAILAGGVGTRLWPRSRQHQPKQFSDITGSGRTMIQATADRLAGLVDTHELYVVTGTQYAALAVAQLEIPATQVILEPSGRSTAPAIGLLCVHLQQRDPQAIVAILPADHVVLDPVQFQRALVRAKAGAAAGYIVTLGIEPTFPHTGYGYIHGGAPVDALPADDLPLLHVQKFLEKPNRSTAEAFLVEGGYYWNGGIFVCRVDVMLAEIARQLPDLAAGLATIDRALQEDPVAAGEILAQVWPTVPNISIDHGIMEHARAVATVPLQAGWNDVGSWDALETVLQQDAEANFVAKGNVLAINSRNNIVYCDKEVVALIDIENLVVVDTGDTLLIGRKEQMQKVKEVVDQLRTQGRQHLL